MLEDGGLGADEKSGVLSREETTLEVTEVMTLLESVGEIRQPVINKSKQIDKATCRTKLNFL